MDFQEKVVIITGASSGIGAATAFHFAKLSAKLVLVARNEKNLKKIALYCGKLSQGLQPLVVSADVTSDEDAQQIIDDTIKHFGKLDVLVNNAGCIEMGGIKNSTMEAYDKTMTTNMRSVYQLTMLAVPHLIVTKGCIVNTSCIASTKVSTRSLAYNMSKAALDQFTKCVALELATDGVRVNSVNPGFVKTNLHKDIGLTDDQLDHFADNVKTFTPLKRPVESDDVASLIAFLASDMAKTITGSNYVIDSGSSLV